MKPPESDWTLPERCGSWADVERFPLVRELPRTWELKLKCRECGHMVPHAVDTTECEGCLEESLGEWMQGTKGTQSMWCTEFFNRRFGSRSEKLVLLKGMLAVSNCREFNKQELAFKGTIFTFLPRHHKRLLVDLLNSQGRFEEAGHVAMGSFYAGAHSAPIPPTAAHAASAHGGQVSKTKGGHPVLAPCTSWEELEKLPYMVALRNPYSLIHKCSNCGHRVPWTEGYAVCEKCHRPRIQEWCDGYAKSLEPLKVFLSKKLVPENMLDFANMILVIRKHRELNVEERSKEHIIFGYMRYNHNKLYVELLTSLGRTHEADKWRPPEIEFASDDDVFNSSGASKEPMSVQGQVILVGFTFLMAIIIFFIEIWTS